MFSVSSLFNKNKQLSKSTGFGLVELLVSISVMLIVTSIIMARHSNFNNAVLLKGQAYELALALREVQLSAVSAAGIAGNFRAVQGVYVSSDANTNGSYRIFRDADGDNRHDTSEEFGRQGQLDPRFAIGEIRADGTVIDNISIVFERPDFDARFFTSTGELSDQLVEIDIVTRDPSDGNEAWTVSVTATGQITVE